MGDISEISRKFRTESEKNQLQLIPQLISTDESGLEVLMEFLRVERPEPVNLVVGKAYQALYQANTPRTQEFLSTYFPYGVVPLLSERNIDYSPLQQLLAKQDFQEADLVTIQKMCELAGEAAVKRKWLYFTEVDKFPATDLRTIDLLWFMHSEGKFGFSVQRQLWLSQGKDYTKLWQKIGWRTDNNWTRYPQEFTWDLSAPKGHLPLSNQLRGVRTIASIFAHPAWSNSNPT
jgi:hypothetical protein